MTPDAKDQLAFLPKTHEELWERWLSWRYPHYDVMEADAKRTLSGTKSAVVRLGWNGTLGAAQEWHVTLFTLNSETGDRAATLAAVQQHKPAGAVLHHVVTERPSADAAAEVDERAAPLAHSVDGAGGARARLLRPDRQCALEPEPTRWTPRGIAVCESCTIVFRPRRRATAISCALCRRRGRGRLRLR